MEQLVFQNEGELGPITPFGSKVNAFTPLETEFLDKFIALVESDPSPRFVDHLRVVDRAEKFKELVLVFFLDADARIDYGDLHRLLSEHLDHVGLNLHVAVESELHGVLYQVYHHLSKASRVGHELRG